MSKPVTVLGCVDDSSQWKGGHPSGSMPLGCYWDAFAFLKKNWRAMFHRFGGGREVIICWDAWMPDAVWSWHPKRIPGIMENPRQV